MSAVWDKAQFEEQYTCVGWAHGIRGATRLPRFHYNWFVYGQRGAQVTINALNKIPDIQRYKNIAIVGGAYGWTAERLEQQDPSIKAISTDTSDYILSTKDTSEEEDLYEYLTKLGWEPDRFGKDIHFMSPEDPNATCDPWKYWLRPDGKRAPKPVIQEDLSNDASRRAAQRAMNHNIDLIITEYVLESQTSYEDALNLIGGCEIMKSQRPCKIVHLVTGKPYDPVFVYEDAKGWRHQLNLYGFRDHAVLEQTGVLIEEEE